MSVPGHIKFTFPKSEKLTSKKSIEGLFNHGSSFYLHPIALKYLPAREGSSVNQVLFAVSKKSLKRAVDRNLLKRRMREAYRLNKSILSGKNNSFFNLAFIYADKKILPYNELEGKLTGLLKRLEKLNTTPK